LCLSAPLRLFGQPWRRLLIAARFGPRRSSLRTLVKLSGVAEELPVLDGVPLIHGQAWRSSQGIRSHVQRENISPSSRVKSDLKCVERHNQVVTAPPGDLGSKGKINRGAIALSIDHKVLDRSQLLMVRTPDMHADQAASMDNSGTDTSILPVVIEKARRLIDDQMASARKRVDRSSQCLLLERNARAKRWQKSLEINK
jgi:hypothetical protein